MQIILLWKNQIITTTKIIALSLKAPFRILEWKQKCKEYLVYFHDYWKGVYSVFENLLEVNWFLKAHPRNNTFYINSISL